MDSASRERRSRPRPCRTTKAGVQCVNIAWIVHEAKKLKKPRRVVEAAQRAGLFELLDPKTPGTGATKLYKLGSFERWCSNGFPTRLPNQEPYVEIIEPSYSFSEVCSILQISVDGLESVAGSSTLFRAADLAQLVAKCQGVPTYWYIANRTNYEAAANESYLVGASIGTGKIRCFDEPDSFIAGAPEDPWLISPGCHPEQLQAFVAGVFMQGVSDWVAEPQMQMVFLDGYQTLRRSILIAASSIG